MAHIGRCNLHRLKNHVVRQPPDAWSHDQTAGRRAVHCECGCRLALHLLPYGRYDCARSGLNERSFGKYPPGQSGGSIPGIDGSHAYTLTRGGRDAPPILLAIPHDGQFYPDDVLQRLRKPEQRLRLEDRHVGLVADLVSASTQLSVLRAHAPRAMIDLNRSTKDIDWTMVSGAGATRGRASLATYRARNGLGLVPRRISGLGEIWREPLRHEELQHRIETIYRPYHDALQCELERLRDQHGVALLLDLHSMPPLRPARSDGPAAEFVVGDRFGATCDAALADSVMAHLRTKGRTVSHNRPYSGGYVLERYGQPRRGIHAIQLELCRGMYLDSRLVEPSARLPVVARLVEGIVWSLGEELRFLGRGWSAQAAE
ncbi:N-formylglutamate amidohydrolase [Qipengyuania sp. XHP0207]|uniref:N-formylglutamate amidohydrolase n=1 Tax=Qipengyuania sp. XHP0207 TaxID=3038078 RepID=UPI00241D0711|nr:N-formylglutamate amidohydrolase [Qipengyuania sp. XHP0207]MDG5747284.1 N-formylglutamate amidohydrolase [Qipengyuania sp. XHP0207]